MKFVPGSTPYTSQSALSHSITPRPVPIGIGGWLHFLCVNLTILSPLYALIFTISTYSGLRPVLPHYPAIRSAWVIATLCLTIPTACSIMVGRALRRRKSHAVFAAKRFFLLSPIAVFLVALPYHMVALPPTLRADLTGLLAINFLSPLIASLHWYLYLSRSRRVAGTFRLPFPAVYLPPAERRATDPRLSTSAPLTLTPRPPVPILIPSAAPPSLFKACPVCAEDVRAAAKICRFCRYEFPTSELGPENRTGV